MFRALFTIVLLASSISFSLTSPAPIKESENVATQKYLAKIHAQLADYFKTIENYFISVLTVGNQRLNKVDEKLEKILFLLNRGNQVDVSTTHNLPHEAGKDIEEEIHPTKLVSVEEMSEAIPPPNKGTTNELVEEDAEFIPDAKEVNHNYYFSDEMNTWYAAEEFCESLNWTLVSIDSEAEIKLLWNLLPQKDECYWTGGSDFGRVPGQFHWRTREGSPGERVSHRFWGVGQPSNYGKDTSTCVVLCGKKLFDFSCRDSVNYFVCKNAD